MAPTRRLRGRLALASILAMSGGNACDWGGKREKQRANGRLGQRPAGSAESLAGAGGTMSQPTELPIPFRLLPEILPAK